MQQVGHLLDSDGFKTLVRESLEICGSDPNLLMYYQWALSHKRCWSDTFAAWCQIQQDLTYQRITQRWRERGAQYREQDLRAQITAANAKRQSFSEPTQTESSQTEETDLPF